jgi:hypothetical protein
LAFSCQVFRLKFRRYILIMFVCFMSAAGCFHCTVIC